MTIMPGQWLGVDVGWVVPAADSDGSLYRWSHQLRNHQFTAAGPVTVRKLDGTTVVHEPYSPKQAEEHRARAEDPQAVVYVASKVVAAAKRTERGIALEDWDNFQNRKAAWVRVWEAIFNRAAEWNVRVVQVDRSYTSITCPSCGHKGRENRPSRALFQCVVCGLAGQADVIAAINIAARAAGTFRIVAAPCKNEACDRAEWRAGLCGRCYRFHRNHSRLPSHHDMATEHEQHDMAAYRVRMRAQHEQERREQRDAVTRAKMMESYRTHDAYGNLRVRVASRHGDA